MLLLRCIAAAVALLVSVGVSRAGGESKSTPPSVDGVSAPIAYEGLMLVLTHEKGVAAIVFGAEIKDGVKYRYRYLPTDHKEKSGTGEVFEKYKRLPGNKSNETEVVDDGSQLYFKAGPAIVEWSYVAKGKGFIYYRPEFVRVQIASARDFNKLDLRRFTKKPPNESH
jgi:hypothetical protein